VLDFFAAFFTAFFAANAPIKAMSIRSLGSGSLSIVAGDNSQGLGE